MEKKLPIKVPEDAKIVSLRDIRVAEGRGRKSFGKIQELVDSIHQHGLIHPIVVRGRGDDGKHELACGERRMRALLMGGYTHAPVSLFENLSPVEMKEIELEENIFRENLEWSEEVELVRQIDEVKREIHGSKPIGPHSADKPGWSMDKTAELLGVHSSTVQKQIKLARQLRDRPDLAEKVKKLPMHVAQKAFAQEVEKERLQRLQASGKLEFRSDLRHGDCIELIKELPDASVDLILTDPPFGVSTIEDMREQQRSTTQSYTSTLKDSDNQTKEQVAALMFQLGPELARVLKPGGHLYFFFAFETYSIMRQVLEKFFELQWVPIIWYKGRSVSVFRGYEYMTCYEPIQFGYKAPRTRRLNKPEKTLIECAPVHSKDKIHAFEKPVKLLRQLIEQSTNPGDTVLDPFAGSGATIVAAQRSGRTGIGFEFSEDNFLQAQSRLMDLSS